MSRGVRLAFALALVIAAGLGLYLLSTIVATPDLTSVQGLAHDRTGALTTFAHAFSWLGRSVVLLPAAAVISVIAARRGSPIGGLAVVVGISGAIVIQNVDKAIVGRPRPPVHHLEQVSSTSFPSGHATEATAFWLLLAIIVGSGPWPRPLKRIAGAMTAVVIVGVAASRVYLGVHYPSDVIAGMLLGGAWAVSCAAVLLHEGSSGGRGTASSHDVFPRAKKDAAPKSQRP